ncbi:carbohydrate kinase [Mucilaginibacter daejeonensis]|uniref:carbohydrate kinase family protein n=1 Tax=Mucilaginibacter daejeonensis TaxID=398049 RepID=UPI001D1751D2|nr:carbohydrate kinase [Mucilaginibacter daejeonensis]UEG51344.1 carbohydrate kinase [Mucilaginibacter daejeonensis]
MKKDKIPLVVCYGEILWDVLPGQRKPGGAPMNVAYHLHKMGIRAELISSVGNDQAGDMLIDFLRSREISTGHIQQNINFPTSEVQARIGEDHEVTYDILNGVAWDHIICTPEIIEVAAKADALVFGSLSARELQSRETLFALIERAKYRVFDVNLRAPFYSHDLIISLLEKADMVKLNVAELMLIARWMCPPSNSEQKAIDLLFDLFEINEVLITKGSKGVTYYTRELRYDHPTYAIEVADTIGSGDAFLASFLANKLTQEPLDVVLDYAVAMGAFITAQPGACPDYSKHDLERFIWQKKYVDLVPQASQRVLAAG